MSTSQGAMFKECAKASKTKSASRGSNKIEAAIAKLIKRVTPKNKVRNKVILKNKRLRVRTAHLPPLTNVTSWHPQGVRRSFFDEKLNLFKASFGVYGIKHQIDGNHLYYFSYFATFSNLIQKLSGSLVKTPIC